MLSVGLVVAMPEEAAHVYNSLGEFVCSKEEHGFKVDTYSCGDKNIHIIGSGIGEINATLATQFLIINYNVNYVINFGVVGTFNPLFKSLDVVAVDEIVHYDFSLDTMDKDSFGKYPFQRDKAEFKTDRRMLDLLHKIDEDIPFVKIATGDKFVANMELRDWIVDTFHADICDMESMGIYYACMRYGVPCLFIKAVSDNADSEAQVSFEKVVENGVAAYVSLVERILKEL